MSMYLSCKAMLVAAGVGQLILCSASLAIPRVLRWPEDLARLRPLTRQVFWTYAGYIWATNLSFGLISTLARAGCWTRLRWPGPLRFHRGLLGGTGDDPVRLLRPQRRAQGTSVHGRGGPPRGAVRVSRTRLWRPCCPGLRELRGMNAYSPQRSRGDIRDVDLAGGGPVPGPGPRALRPGAGRPTGCLGPRRRGGRGGRAARRTRARGRPDAGDHRRVALRHEGGRGGRGAEAGFAALAARSVARVRRALAGDAAGSVRPGRGGSVTGGRGPRGEGRVADASSASSWSPWPGSSGSGPAPGCWPRRCSCPG